MVCEPFCDRGHNATTASNAGTSASRLQYALPRAAARLATHTTEGVMMGQPVVHFEVIGKNPEKLRRYYNALFGWEFDTAEV